MSDLIEISLEARPWQPTPSTDSIVVLDEYNIPLAGIVRQGGVPYLYVCAAGEEAEANVWLYALLESEEIERLETARGNELVRRMAECVQGRTITVALAESWQLVDWDHFDVEDEKPGAIVRRYLRLAETKTRQREQRLVALHHDASISDTDESQLAITYSSS
jgi:hypothetical protein